jgi:hypothetical protein
VLPELDEHPGKGRGQLDIVRTPAGNPTPSAAGKFRIFRGKVYEQTLILVQLSGGKFA